MQKEKLLALSVCRFKSAYENLEYFEVYKLSEVVAFSGGSQPPKDEHLYEPQSGYVRFIQNRDYADANHLTFIKESKSNKLCDVYDIMMDKYGEAGKVRFGIAGAYNVALGKLICKIPNSQEWIRAFLSQHEIEGLIANSCQASTRPSLNSSTLDGLEIRMSNAKTLERFEIKNKAIITRCLNISAEIETFQRLKSAYLKKFFG
jgi:type I restriction enzyme S subunit